MKLNLNLKIVLPVVVLILIVGAVFIGKQITLKHQDITQTKSQPVLFQPEGALLNQAIDPKSTGGQTTINTAGYVFDPAACQTSSASYLCFAKYYETMTTNFGATTAISDLKLRGTQNASVLSDCHPLMHVIGRTAAKSYSTATEAFQHGDVYCWSGYYHGIMEGLVAKIGLKNLPAELDQICAGIPGKASYTFEYYNCVHGLGHGIMALLGDDVFGSLAMCDNLTGSWEQQSCYGGVFMQNIIDSTNVADTDNVVKDLKPSEPLYPCTAVDDKYKGQCYLGQTSYALQVNDYDFKKVFQICATVAKPYRDICNQSMGRDAANQAYHGAAKTKQTCALGVTANDVTNCVIGAVKEIISYYHAETQALGFCDVLDASDKAVCKSTADSYYTVFK